MHRRCGKVPAGFHLVAANANSYDVAIVVASRELKNFLRLLDSELPDGIEDPQQRDAEISRAPSAAPFQSFKNGGEILLAPKAHADRNVNLRMQNIFFFQRSISR